MTLQSLVHALIEDLAAGKLVQKSQFQLTEDQKNVKIPSYLVYLAGLIVKTSSSSTPSARENEQFESLQKVFAGGSNKADGELPMFRLSPRLYPTEDQLASIQADLKRKQEELETKARQAAQDLLSSSLYTEDEGSIDVGSTKTKSITKKKKKTNHNKQKSKRNETHCVTEDAQTSDEDGGPSSTLEQVLLQIQTETTSTITRIDDDDDDSDATGWIPVSKHKEKQNKNMNIHQCTKSQPIQPPSTSTNDGKDCATKASYLSPSSSTGDRSKNHFDLLHPSSEKTIDSDDVQASRAGTTSSNALRQHETSEQKGQPFATNEPADAATTRAREPTTDQTQVTKTAQPDIHQTVSQSALTLDALEDRIRQLEEALKTKEEELQIEKQTNAKMLSQKQQQFDDHVQALQLRLYISETRLKTFEEALEQHVQAVATNVATSMECTNDSGRSSRQLRKYSSPRKWTNSSSSEARNEKEETPSSPLISKMLSFQKKMMNPSD